MLKEIPKCTPLIVKTKTDEIFIAVYQRTILLYGILSPDFRFHYYPLRFIKNKYGSEEIIDVVAWFFISNDNSKWNEL